MGYAGLSAPELAPAIRRPGGGSAGHPLGGQGGGQKGPREQKELQGHVEHQTFESFRIERHVTTREREAARSRGLHDDGTVVQFTQSVDDVAGGQGDRWKATVRDLMVVGTSDTAGEPYMGRLVDIEYGLKGHLEDIWFEGGKLGVRLFTSSHMFMRDLYVHEKTGAPDFLLIERGGSHTLISPRAEGSLQEGVSFHLLGCSNTTIIDPKTEGDRESDIYRIENCSGIVIINPGVAVNSETTARHPRGMKFINSKAVRVINGHAAQRHSYFERTQRDGRTIEIDADCRNVIIDGLVIDGNNLSNEIVNNGVDSWVLAYAKGSSPSHAPFMVGQMSGGGMLARNVTQRFGTVTEHPVEFVRNNTARARLGGSAFEVLDRLDTSAADEEGAGLRVPHGTAPESPVDGDIWTTEAGVFVQISGQTREVNLT